MTVRNLFQVAVSAVASIGLVAIGSAPTSASSRASLQVELDRIVSRVNGRIITQSDVRQARALKLVDDTSSDDAARRALENRWLILAEIARGAPLPPASAAELAARRSEWHAAAPTETAAAGMPDAELQTWLRDDLRIRAYLARQFGILPEADRARARGEWLSRLRQRAELE